MRNMFAQRIALAALVTAIASAPVTRAGNEARRPAFKQLAAEPKSSVDGQSPQPARFLLEWGKHGSAEGEFNFPIGIAVGRNDTVFVADFYNGRVQLFTKEGKFRSALQVLPNPGGIALDEKG